jgi:hypothetical protein
MGVPQHQPQLELEARYNSFAAGLDMQAQAESSEEPVKDNFYREFADFLHRSTAAQAAIYGHLAVEPVTNPGYHRRQLFASAQALLLDDKLRSKADYPHAFADQGTWTSFFGDNLVDVRNPLYQKFGRLLDKPYQKNNYKRGVIIAAVAAGQKVRERLKGPVRCSEIGAGHNLVLTAFAMHRFGRVMLLGADGTLDNTMSSDFNIAARGTELHSGVGVERHPPKTPEDLDYIKSCTFDKPSRLETVGRGGQDEEFYDFMAINKPPNVSMIQGDMLNLTSHATQRLVAKRANIASLSFVIGQNEKLANELVARVIPTVATDGKILVTDRLRIDPDNRGRLIPENDWDADSGACKTVMLDVNHPEKGYKHIIDWQDGDCEVGTPGPDYDAIGLSDLA